MRYLAYILNLKRLDRSFVTFKKKIVKSFGVILSDGTVQHYYPYMCKEIRLILIEKQIDFTYYTCPREAVGVVYGGS